MSKSNYKADYVVIGAGSSGTVVVRRLIDAGHSVILLEAGPVDDSEAIHDPLGSIGLWNSPYNWAFETVPQRFANERILVQPRGKTLGGSSSFNGMVAVRGVKQDYDQWSQLGAHGWDWDSVEPYFRKLEDFEGGNKNGRGVGGPLHIQINHSPNELIKDWVLAAQQAGFTYNEDYNSGDISGVSFTQHTILKHRRQSSWVAYGREIENHPNLTIFTSAHVTSLIFNGTRVVGVNFVKDKQVQSVFSVLADKEVILSAGVFGTPQILMLSGIGDADELQKLDIAVKVNLPGVGKNLQEHISSAFIWETNDVPPAPTQQGLEAHIFAKTREGLLVPDVQPILMSFVYTFIGGEMPANGFSTVSQIIHPLSRGHVSIRSLNPLDAPLIDLNVLSEPDDLEVLVNNMFMIREIGHQAALQKWIKREVQPGDQIRTREAMGDFVRNTVVSGHHQVGTSRMGLDNMSVVDPQLKVHGVEGLRVVDASIMPTLPTGNTNIPAIMIGEKASDIILNKKK
jgi:choline dehydrogenase